VRDGQGVRGRSWGDKRETIPRLIHLVRPAPLESLGSLLERLRVVNHYQEPQWLGGLLVRHPARPEVLRRARDFQILGALTGLDRATLVDLTLHRFAPWYGVDRRLGRPLPAGVAYLPVPLWPDIGGGENTRASAGVCPACWGEQAVILLPWWLHHLTACPQHLILLRQRCAGCDAPLRLVAGQAGCGQCGVAIAAMPTRSIAGDADEVEMSALLWRATGCVEGAFSLEGHPLGRLRTPTLLDGLWACAQTRVAGDRGLRLQTLDIAAVHEALVAAWRVLRVADPGGTAFPLILGGRGTDGTARMRAKQRPVSHCLKLCDTQPHPLWQEPQSL